MMRLIALALLLAAATVTAVFLWEGHQGLSLADESYLVYGAKRVTLGEVPIRDFMAYDPGRYYSAAALMRIWGDNGSLALRGAVAVFQAIGLYIAIVAFGALGIVWAVRERIKKKVASAFLALPYAYYSDSRADVGRLCKRISPFLIGSFMQLASQREKIKVPFVSLLCRSGLFVVHLLHLGWQSYASEHCVEARVAESRPKIDSGTAGDLAMVNKTAEQFAPGDRGFIVIPFWTGAHAVPGRESPLGENHAQWPCSEYSRRSEIARIKSAKPGGVAILDLPLDRRDDFSFLVDYSENPAHQIYQLKQSEQ